MTLQGPWVCEIQCRLPCMLVLTCFSKCSMVCLAMHATSLQSYPTLCNLTIYSPPGSSVHGILQARILECMAIPFSRSYQVLTNIVHFCLLSNALLSSLKKHITWISAGPRMRPMENMGTPSTAQLTHTLNQRCPGSPIGLWTTRINIILILLHIIFIIMYNLNFSDSSVIHEDILHEPKTLFLLTSA